MQHKGTVLIETNKLKLRRFVLNDSISAFRNWTNDSQVTEFLRWTPHQNIETTEKIVKAWVDSYAQTNFYQWAIVLKSNNEPIGSIGVVTQNDALDILQIGYCIGSKWWHQGIMSEAFSGVISFLFNEIGVNRIEAQHDPQNPNSGKVMIKCGLKYEGTLRKSGSSNKGIVDMSMYSILASEFFEKQK